MLVPVIRSYGSNTKAQHSKHADAEIRGQPFKKRRNGHRGDFRPDLGEKLAEAIHKIRFCKLSQIKMNTLRDKGL